MATYRTPGVYTEEISSFPPSIAEVASAIPVFIGHTRFAQFNGVDLTNQAVRVESLKEYEDRYGSDAPYCLDAVVINSSNQVDNVSRNVRYNLPTSIRKYFENGGSVAHIISVGDFTQTASGKITKDKIESGLQIAAEVDEVTLLLMPDLCNLEDAQFFSIQQAALRQCVELMDRFALLDVKEIVPFNLGAPTYLSAQISKDNWRAAYQKFRDGIGINGLRYGATYTPWVVTDDSRNINYAHIANVLKKSDGTALKLIDLATSSEIKSQISRLEQATFNVASMATKTYRDLANTSPLVNILPNVSVNAGDSTDMQKYFTQTLPIDLVDTLSVKITLPSGVAELTKVDGKDASSAAVNVDGHYGTAAVSNDGSVVYTPKSDAQLSAGKSLDVIDVSFEGKDAEGQDVASSQSFDFWVTASADATPVPKVLAPAANSAGTAHSLEQLASNSLTLASGASVDDESTKASDAIKTAFNFLQLVVIGCWVDSNVIDGDIRRLVADQVADLCNKLTPQFAVLSTTNVTATTQVLDVQSDFAALKASLASLKTCGVASGEALTMGLATSVFKEVQACVSAVQLAAIQQLNTLESSLLKNFPLYTHIVEAARRSVNTLPPSGLMAGIYSSVDAERGVWKAPANVSVSAISELNYLMDDRGQEDVNIDVNGGKSINALRTFPGRGDLVWGARTLMGNDNEWRYIPVRRFFNMVEESVKKSTQWAVFEPNDANLWVKVKGSIEGYLNEKWKQGALAGATAPQAFYVNVGLGTTMTAQDILEGRMIVEIGMAVVRPAEFVIMRYSQMMQQS